MDACGPMSTAHQDDFSAGGFLEQRLEPEASARRSWWRSEVDLLAMVVDPTLTAVSPRKTLIETLTMEVTGLGKYALPQTHRQQLKGRQRE